MAVRILAVLASARRSLSVQEIQRALGGKPSLRTIHRRLGALIAEGAVSVAGEGRATKYSATSKLAPSNADAPLAEKEPYVPVTSESREIVEYVRRSVTERHPVGYDAEFLASYQPNETFYLSREIRDHLRAIGTVLSERRPAGTYARDIMSRLLIDLSWASSKLEGNTYSRLDTQRLIELGREAPAKDRAEAQMILNHKAAIELLIENAATIDFDSYTFLNLHALLSDNLLADPSEGGRLRRRIVHITGSVFQPLGLPQQVETYFQLMLSKAKEVADPFEQSFFVMVHLPYLQPFIDVNKRVSRLGANIPLIKQNFCPLSFVDVPERAYVEGTVAVYELCQVALLRDVYVWAYERSCQRYAAIKQTVAEPDPFRLGYREAIIEVVGRIVRGGFRPSARIATKEAGSFVPAKDRRRFVDMVLSDLADLHEGNLARYRLRLSEYRAWKEAAGRR